jgi:hypothetical protein
MILSSRPAGATVSSMPARQETAILCLKICEMVSYHFKVDCKLKTYPVSPKATAEITKQ